MPTLLAVSPHLDDAVFSAGGALSRRAREGWRVVVATCFTATMPDPRGFALACQLDKGLRPEVDYMALRRAEDIAACAAVGAEARHLPLPEAPHRGYASAPALFGPRLADDRVDRALRPALERLLAELLPELIWGPQAIGDHVDHHVVRDLLDAMALPAPLQLWEDWPYADRAPRGPATLAVPLDAAAKAAKLDGCLAYRSQLGFQFGGAERLRERLEGIAEERFAALERG